jgi:hypothetical protein
LAGAGEHQNIHSKIKHLFKRKKWNKDFPGNVGKWYRKYGLWVEWVWRWLIKRLD